MLNDYDGIAEPAKPPQYAEQSVVVAFVETYRRLIKNVTYADQTAANLGGQADSLSLTARKSAAPSIQRQILKPNVNHKLQSRFYFL